MDESLKDANILIVDDQIANIDVLEGYLQMQGYLNIKTTVDPREVVPFIASFRPDIILLDLSMPYLSGFEVMEQLKLIVPPDSFLPILVLTADVTTEAKQKALSGGAKDFLTKPFDLVEVGLRIKNLLLTTYLQQQQIDTNKVLEKKVQERTFELEQTNKELTIAKDKAEAGDRLKTAFMQNVSHEVRTPLNGILGFCSIITDASYPAEDKQRLIPMLESSCNRLINTITNYIDLSLIVSKNIKATIKTTNVTRTLNELIDQFSGICDEKNISIKLLTTESNDTYIPTDPKLFKKIVSHLIDNAVKFTNQGLITVAYTIDAADLDVYIKDTGVGIEKASQERIFDSFIQEDLSVSRGYEGSGVGLTVVKGLLDILGGKIQLSSEKGKGSTFTITLPKANLQVEEDNDNSTTNKRPTIKGSVLLVAEDDYPNRIYIQTLLKDCSSQIYLAENGREAVELCREHPEISLVLMDIKMPEMNGIDATREIKTFRKDLPIVAVTAYAMSESEKDMYEAGCSDFLQKPINLEKLFNLLKIYGLDASQKTP